MANSDELTQVGDTASQRCETCGATRHPIAYVDGSMFDDAFLEHLRSEGDAEADEHMAAYFERLNPGDDPDLARALRKHAPHSEGSAKTLDDFTMERPALPSWITENPDLIREGQSVFLRYVPQFGMSLWLASIPSGYAGARDVKALAGTGQLKRYPERRFLETGQFVLDVMTNHALEPGGIGYEDARHVRLMHALVRYMLCHESDELVGMDDGTPVAKWDVDRNGVPLDQLGLLATMFTFSVVGLESLEKLGIEVTEREAEAYTFLWSAVGHLMGIREDLLPLNVADSRQVWESIKRREYSTSKEGRELTLAAIDQMKKMIPGRIGDGLAVSGMRFLLGEDTSDLLGVPPADWTRHLFVSSELFGGIFTLVNRVPVGRQLSKWVGYRIFKEFLETSRGEDRDGLFEVPEELDRLLGAKRPSWRTRMKPSIPRRAASASNRG